MSGPSGRHLIALPLVLVVLALLLLVAVAAAALQIGGSQRKWLDGLSVTGNHTTVLARIITRFAAIIGFGSHFTIHPLSLWTNIKPFKSGQGLWSLRET